MLNRDYARLQHMLDAAQAATQHLSGRSRIELDLNRLLLNGIVRELEILGEAASQITEKTREQFPDLPWREMVGLRNRLIHAYFDVNHQTIWLVIKTQLATYDGSDSSSFPLEARKNKRTILENIVLLFSKLVRASRAKITSNMTVLVGGKLGLKNHSRHLSYNSRKSSQIGRIINHKNQPFNRIIPCRWNSFETKILFSTL